MRSNKEIIVLSLGGSLIVPEAIDTDFVGQFRNTIIAAVAKGKRFLIITGGGKVCRVYQKAASLLGVQAEDLDWLGIQVTRLNGFFMRQVFKDLAHSEVLVDPATLKQATEDIIIGAGWKPGHSTDYDAVVMAEHLGAKKIANLSNIDYVYDKDPREFPDAQKIENITWKEFRKILPAKWSPGLNAPFDPIAAERAEKLGIEIAVLNGRNIENLEAYLDGKPFAGTLITP